jgi:hypothetical protein
MSYDINVMWSIWDKPYNQLEISYYDYLHKTIYNNNDHNNQLIFTYVWKISQSTLGFIYRLEPNSLIMNISLQSMY